MDLDFDEEASLGPKMKALTVRQRRFVRAALEFPTAKDWQIAKAAGYSDKSNGFLRKQACVLFHDEAIIAALHEEAGKRLRASAVLGASVLAEVARTKGHPQQLKAAEALLNRIGFHEMTEHKVSVDHRDETGAALIGRIEKLASVLGVDAGQLLGVNAPKLIEGTVADPKEPG